VPIAVVRAPENVEVVVMPPDDGTALLAGDYTIPKKKRQKL
jgi:hypothetical protein